jgi:hypothetical protein
MHISFMSPKPQERVFEERFTIRKVFILVLLDIKYQTPKAKPKNRVTSRTPIIRRVGFRQAYTSSRMVDIVTDMYSDDIEQFGYTFE